MSKTVHIESPSQFSSILSSSRIVVTDFYADWCGPCKVIAPVYEQLSAQLSRPNTITFTKVNTDTQKQIAQTYNITAMPTFLIFKAGRETKRIKGANGKELNEAVKQLAQEASNPDNNASGSSASGSGLWTGASLPRGYSDITDSTDLLSLDFLNVDSEAGGARAIFSTERPAALDAKGKAVTGKKDFVQSDTDEQLMLFMPFQSTLKLHTIHLTSLPPADAEEEDDEAPSRPKTLKLYTNRSTVLGFDEADDTPCTQEVQIKEGDWDSKTGTAKVELRFVKFQNISSLVLFIVDNESGSEKTRVDRIRFVGESGEKRAMGKLEKIGDEQGE